MWSAGYLPSVEQSGRLHVRGSTLNSWNRGAKATSGSDVCQYESSLPRQSTSDVGFLSSGPQGNGSINAKCPDDVSRGREKRRKDVIEEEKKRKKKKKKKKKKRIIIHSHSSLQ